MNDLPQVLQREIWEYVRGDRAFWKSQMNKVLNPTTIHNTAVARLIDKRPKHMSFILNPEIVNQWSDVMDQHFFGGLIHS